MRMRRVCLSLQETRLFPQWRISVFNDSVNIVSRSFLQRRRIDLRLQRRKKTSLQWVYPKFEDRRYCEHSVNLICAQPSDLQLNN